MFLLFSCVLNVLTLLRSPVDNTNRNSKRARDRAALPGPGDPDFLEGAGAVGNALAFGAGATGGRAHGAAAAGADAEFETAWDQRTAQIRGTVEHKLMSLFPVALSGAARTAWVDKQSRLFVVLVFVLKNFAEACTKTRRSIWYEYPGFFDHQIVTPCRMQLYAWTALPT